MPVIEYKCPNCGSGMVFDGETGMLSCHSCGREDNIESIPDPLINRIFQKMRPMSIIVITAEQ